MEREQKPGRGFSPCYIKPQKVSPSRWGCGFRSVVLNHRQFCPSGDIWPGLGTFLIVMTRDVGCAIDIRWVKARDIAKYPTKHRKASHNKELSYSKCE